MCIKEKGKIQQKPCNISEHLGDEFHDSEVIASYVRRFQYSDERKEEVLRKLAENKEQE